MLAIYREGVGKRPDALRMPGPRAGPVAPGMWTRRKQVPANDVPPRWGAVGSLQIAGRSCKRHAQTALGKVKWAGPCRPWRGAPSQPKEGIRQRGTRSSFLFRQAGELRPPFSGNP
jgi:hypothetical protein